MCQYNLIMSLRVFCCGDSMSLRYASISLSVFIIVLTTLQTASTAITINKLKDDETYKHMANALYVELTTNVMIFVNLLLVICVLSLKYPYCIQCLAIFYACEIIFRFVLACVMAKMDPNFLRICRDYVSLAVYFYAALIFWNFNKDQKSSEREIKSSVAHELLISVA